MQGIVVSGQDVKGASVGILAKLFSFFQLLDSNDIPFKIDGSSIAGTKQEYPAYAT